MHWICTGLSVVPFARPVVLQKNWTLSFLDLKCVSAYIKTEILRWSVVRLTKSQHMKKFPLPKGKLSTKEAITILIFLGLCTLFFKYKNVNIVLPGTLGSLALCSHCITLTHCSVKTQVFLFAVWRTLFLNWIWGAWPSFCGSQAFLSHWPAEEWAYVLLEDPLCQHNCVIHVGNTCLFTGSWLHKKFLYYVWKFLLR